MTDDATIVLLFVPALQNLEKFFFPAGALVKFGGEPAVQAASIIRLFFWKRYGMSLFSPLRDRNIFENHFRYIDIYNHFASALYNIVIENTFLKMVLLFY